jgi:hypothetical protein
LFTIIFILGLAAASPARTAPGPLGEFPAASELAVLFDRPAPDTVAAPSPAPPPAAPASAPDSSVLYVYVPADSTVSPTLRKLEERFIRLIITIDPVRASLLGLPQGDRRLGPAGFVGVGGMRRALTGFETELLAAADSLDSLVSPDDRFDLALMLHDVRFSRFELDSLRIWERDPGHPLRVAAGGIQSLLDRQDDATRVDRLWALVARQQAIPDFLRKALPVIDRPPRALLEQAIAQADALSGFLMDAVPGATGDLDDSTLVEALSSSRTEALKAVWDYRASLLADHLQSARGDAVLGPALFAAYLQAAEGGVVDLPALRARADDELERLDALFRETAARIDSSLAPSEVMFRVSADHPPETGVLATAGRAISEARSFLLTDGCVPVPKTAGVEVRATPRVSRWATASLSGPGPFETAGHPAVFYVTLPDPLASPEVRAEQLRFLNRPLLANLAVHEVYPGHLVQILALASVDRPARRAAQSRAFAEGWAHYAESLMLERGFRAGDDAFRLVTLQSALRRAGRFRVALGLHTEGWTVNQAALFLEGRCYLESSVALREARRGVFDPLYLVYSLGRLQLEDLRAEAQRREGRSFDLARFHRRLLALGAPPLPLARAYWLRSGLGGGGRLD